MINSEIIFPEGLKPGDRIALISPASAVKREYVEGAMERIAQFGYKPELMEFALGNQDGSFAASRDKRLRDLLKALEDPDIKAIFCNRGGYGCCQLMPYIPEAIIRENPKWIIGFSDISALLAMWSFCGVASVHGPMAKHLATMPADDPCTLALFKLLENSGEFEYTVEGNPLNREGEAEGVLLGGNFAVLNGLIGSRYDIFNDASAGSPACGDSGLHPSAHTGKGVILFIEDISEPIYKVNRMLWQLELSGGFKHVKGIIFGQFTDYKPDANYDSMESMLDDFISTSQWLGAIPIAFNFPTGHVPFNLPLPVGATVTLSVAPSSVTLSSASAITSFPSQK